ncbi:MAG: DKNYY domain-containing protein [Bacteroidales bacterium]|nr:DKNYY domain-containing protein [Bacteroidales bacterium]
MGSVITHYQCLYFKFGVFSLLVWAPIALMAILFLIIAIVVGNISLNALLIFIALFIFLLPYPLYLFFLYRWGRRWTERTRIQSIYYLVPLLPIVLLVLFSSLGQSKWFRPKPHWADTETFEWLDNGYSKDIHHAYHDSTVIEGADPATFRVLDYHYAADAYHVFFKLRMIPEADPSSFKVLPLMNKGEEDEARTIYLARDAHDYYVRDIPLHVADYRSFRRIKNKWAVDNQKVYYFGRESEKFDVICSPVFDSRNFHVLSYCFASDGHYVYHEGTIIEGADPATFKVVGNDNNISQDKNHVYYATEKRPLRNVYALKHKSEFLYESFHTNDTIVYNPKLQPMPEGTDYATIHDIGTDWYADKDRVYYENRIVPEADPQTFESCHAYSILKDTVIRIKHGHRVYGIYAHDAKHIYRRDTILEVADTATFVCGRSFVDTLRFAFDKYRFYEGHPTPAIEKLRKRLIAP